MILRYFCLLEEEMAFFDEIGRKIVQVGTDVYGKTKDATDIVKINSMISERNKALNQYYMALGKKFYDTTNIENISAPDQLDLFEKIRETIATINVYNEQIKALKGVEKCPYCNGDIVNGSQFCSHCGRRIVKTERPKCSVCGAPIDDDALFCTNCGAKIDRADADNKKPEKNSYADNDHSAEILKDAIQNRTPEINEWKCQNCGNIQSKSIKRCLQCGELISVLDDDFGDTAGKMNNEHIYSSDDSLTQGEYDPESRKDGEEEIKENNKTEVAENQMKKCANCGAYMEMDNLFCTECGHKFGDEKF